ncbi:hypothetical protein GGS23DRAFT_603248 [Durotheca rogersii]|uniref:uncharacterized protein n=1 Tax=Durotheca rogersii TaxID=419775 RepID=UPI00221F9513|nr:uncharacterized protein GGS23DRAFT_603248 [Durotheca rogersii]KAI5865702.1 hypothetical protein GGS23DRAFT_603248 [Durotheca rogersii]
MFLRRPVFITFALLFVAMIVVLEVLFGLSKRNQGVTESDAGLRYLWTYGPTAFLTLVHALWNRVDYEAKATAPWLKADPVLIGRDALLLDYVDMLPIEVPFRALKRRDFVVAASSTISLLLTALIVLSTGLFTLSPVQIFDQSVPISLQSRFVDDLARLSTPSALPFYGLRGLAEANLKYPDGCSSQYAYQSFASDLQGISELHATVDGMYMDLDCEKASVRDLRLTHIIWTNISSMVWGSELNLEYGDCRAPVTFDANPLAPMMPYVPFRATNTETTFVHRNVHLVAAGGLTPGQCGTGGLDHNRLVYLSLELYYKLANETETKYFDTDAVRLDFEVTDAKSAALVCAPTYGITPVDVVRNATGIMSVTPHGDDPPRLFPGIHPWNIMQANLDTFETLRAEPISIGNATVDDYASEVFRTCGDPCSQFSSMLDAPLVEDLMSKYYRKYASFLLHQSLMVPADIESTAAVSRVVDRLFVQVTACQWMVGIMVLCVIILAWLSSRRTESLTVSIPPGSILATAALAGHVVASKFPRDLGAVDAKTLEARIGEWSDNVHATYQYPVDRDAPRSGSAARGGWKQEADGLLKPSGGLKPVYPFVLRPIFRIAIYAVVVGCVVALELVLQKSNREEGLGDVYDDTYLHYVWTVLPAAFFSLLGLVFVSADSQTRLLVPYHSLTRGAPMDESIDVDLLRPLMPQVLHEQFRTRSAGPLMTTVAALIASTFAIGTGSLYRARTFPIASPVELRTTSTFSVATHTGADSNLESSLILASNLSYSSLAYENLVFPEFSLEKYVTTNASQVSDESSIVIEATVPAIRPQLSCHLYSESDITYTFFRNQTIGSSINRWVSDGFAINITGESCPGRWFPETLMVIPNNTATFTMDFPAEGYFGTGSNVKRRSVSGCSYFLYTWGKFSASTDPPSLSASALGCNATAEAVDVTVTLIGPRLQLDPSRPPRPIESTARPVPIEEVEGGDSAKIPMLIPLTMYDNLASLPPPSNNTTFDAFFEQLVTSRYAVPLSAVGDPAQAATVRDAITFQHGVIAAQYYSNTYRTGVPTEPTTITTPLFPSLSEASSPAGGDTGVYPGTASDPYGRRRLAQDTASTRVLEALLLGTLALSLAGWALGPRGAVLPRSPSGIAGVLALLAGGDVLERLYQGRDGDGGARWESLAEARSAFPAECSFWMGWGPAPGGGEQRFGIWAVKVN